MCYLSKVRENTYGLILNGALFSLTPTNRVRPQFCMLGLSWLTELLLLNECGKTLVQVRRSDELLNCGLCVWRTHVDTCVQMVAADGADGSSWGWHMVVAEGIG